MTSILYIFVHISKFGHNSEASVTIRHMQHDVTLEYYLNTGKILSPFRFRFTELLPDTWHIKLIIDYKHGTLMQITLFLIPVIPIITTYISRKLWQKLQD